ncbi:MAG: universal stress protein [Chromatiales bacterium]|nr:universal stress protein [Chromatiales bacterium]
MRLGQATAKVIGHAHCSVLVVPRNTETTGRRFVLATDGSPYAEAATAMAGSLAKILGAPVSALSVTLPSQSAQRHEEARSAANRAAAFLAESRDRRRSRGAARPAGRGDRADRGRPAGRPDRGRQPRPHRAHARHARQRVGAGDRRHRDGGTGREVGRPVTTGCWLLAVG